MKLQEKTMGENFLEDKKTNLETMLECIDKEHIYIFRHITFQIQMLLQVHSGFRYY